MSQQFDPYRRWLGITPEEQPANHYRLLGLSLFEADPEVIEQAADRQIGHVQSHKVGELAAQASTVINALVAARHCLLNAESKANYDKQLRAKYAVAKPAAAPIRTVAAIQAPPSSAPLQAAAAAPVARLPAAPVMDFVPESPNAVRRYRRGKGKSQSSSLVLAAAVVGAALSLCVIGWALMNAGKTIPPDLGKPKPAASGIAGAKPAEKSNPAGNHFSKSSRANDLKTAHDDDPSQGNPVDNGPQQTAIDLLAVVNPDRDDVDGKWRKAGKNLVLTPVDPNRLARILLPYRPPAEYQVDLTVARSLKGDVILGLVVGDRQVCAVIDGWLGTASGLQMVNRKPADSNPTTHKAIVLKPGRPTPIRITVKPDEVTVSCNHRNVIHWQGSASQLSLPVECRAADQRALFLAGNRDGYTISRLEVTPLSGSGELVDAAADDVVAKVAQDSGPAPGNASGNVEPGDEKSSEGPIRPKAFQLGTGSPNPRVQRVPVARRPAPKPEDLADIPDESAQAGTRKLVREVYADRYKQAKKPLDKAALAEQLLDEAAKAENPVEQFVLYSEARSQAVAGGSPALVVQAVQNLGDHFKVLSAELIAESLDQINREAVPGVVRKELAEILVPIAEREIEQENYDLAKRLLALAYSAAGKTNDKQLIKDIKSRGSDLAELRRGAEGLKTAQKILDDQPDDPDANLAKGKYLCFIKSDWSAGLAHLAKGSDSSLQAVAKLEIEAAGSPDDQSKIADAWWSLAEPAKGREKLVFQSRAAHWYATALPLLKGLSQTKASKRLEELTTAKAKPPASAATPVAGNAPVEKPTAGSPAKSLVQRIKTAVKKDLLTRTRMGGDGGGLTFFDVSDYGVLVGFNYTIAERFNGTGYITSIQPIYQGQKGVVKGRVFGGTLGGEHTVLAKKGYAVAGMNASMFHYFYGMELIFMAVDAGGTLDPKDQYTSDWQGSGQQYTRTRVGGDGTTLIGIFGFGGDYLTGMGFVQLPKQ